MGRNPSDFRGDRGGGPEHPVGSVSWYDADRFCRKLSQRPEEQAAGRRYRLPAEAEWEYACRAGTDTPHCFPGRFTFAHGVLSTLKGPMRTGSRMADKWGLFDMHGNVAGWTADRYGPYPPGDAADTVGPESGEHRVFRGGSWTDRNPVGLRSAARSSADPGTDASNIGFRVVCEPVR